ncbi:hypothetical protein [Corynebacterium cystitidis]|uniref:hypothetical protein n=1 Tax=Corynebacterium cystitidis TaxID=35757 RepID=UPI00211F2C71|nr:hypothetical protein [Corynebacterium cystitidis]
MEQWQHTIPERVGKPLANTTPIPGVKEVRAIVDKLAAAVAQGRNYSEAVHEILCADLFDCPTDTESAIAAMTRRKSSAGPTTVPPPTPRPHVTTKNNAGDWWRSTSATAGAPGGWPK